jgi:predicted acetylornithine/succinylornithine family transaminase
VITDEGDRLLDCVGGIGVNVLGHGHPGLTAAIAAQAAALIHASNLYFTEPQVALAERLVAGAFPARVFYANSGAEANEAAIKVARKWGQREKGGAQVVVTLSGAFHGRTLGTLAATGRARYSDAFQPLPLGFRQVARGDLDALEGALDADAVAVLLEPVQGESGIFPLADSELKAIRQLCDRHECLLIVDEVQSGVGRTGRMWAHQWSGIVPDIMTAAKGLAGGVPIGVALVGPRADVLEPGDHGTTFGGNPLACAAGLAVLDAIEGEELLQNATTAGDRLRAGLLRLQESGMPILEVRGRGLMIGVGLRRPIAPALAAASMEHGLLVNAIGQRTVRLLPPLTLSPAECDLAVERLGAAFSACAGQRAPVA